MRINEYQVIDLATYIGRKHFLAFKDYDDPTYSLTVEMDISEFYNYIKTQQRPAYLSLIYLINNALNQIQEFRLRYYQNELRLYDYCDPGFTIMTDVGHYDNCDDVRIHADYETFIKEAQIDINKLKDGSGLNNDVNDERVDQIYYSSVPWISFSAATQVMHNNHFAYIPRICWDKFQFKGDQVTMHLNIQVHHAIIAGYPLAQAFQAVQQALDNPQESLR